MRKFVFLFFVLLSLHTVAQDLSQQDKDVFYSENKTWLTLQRSRVSNLVNFMNQHGLQSISYYDTQQTYVTVSSHITKTRIWQEPSVTVTKHPRFPSGELGAYIVGVLKGKVPYMSLSFQPDITGHTFAMFIHGSNPSLSFGSQSMENEGDTYTLPTSLYLFQTSSNFFEVVDGHVDYTSLIVIPASHVQQLSESDRSTFLRLFSALNGGRD